MVQVVKKTREKKRLIFNTQEFTVINVAISMISCNYTLQKREKRGERGQRDLHTFQSLHEWAALRRVKDVKRTYQEEDRLAVGC